MFKLSIVEIIESIIHAKGINTSFKHKESHHSNEAMEIKTKKDPFKCLNQLPTNNYFTYSFSGQITFIMTRPLCDIVVLSFDYSCTSQVLNWVPNFSPQDIDGLKFVLLFGNICDSFVLLKRVSLALICTILSEWFQVCRSIL